MLAPSHLQQAWLAAVKDRWISGGLRSCLVRPHLLSLILPMIVSLLAELLELPFPALELMASGAASLGLELNWQKTKIQALGRSEGVPPTVTVHGHEVAVAEEFVYGISAPSFIHQSKAP